MADGILTQQQAAELIKMDKHRENDDRYRIPDRGEKLIIPLTAHIAILTVRN